MQSQKGERAKDVQITEQQPKILQITQDIVRMPPTPYIAQMPATQDIVQIPATPDILQIAAQMVEIQPLKRALGGNRYLEFKGWNGSKRVDLRLWKDCTVPTKEGVSLHLESLVQHVGGHRRFAYYSHRKRTSRLAIPYRRRRSLRHHQGIISLRSHQKALYSPGEWTYRPTRRGVALHFGEWKELKIPIPLMEEREPELT